MTQSRCSININFEKTSWEEIETKDFFPRDENKAELTFKQVSKSCQHPFVHLWILTRALSFPIVGTVPTLQDPTGPYTREAGEELRGAGGVLALALPSSGALGLCLGLSDLSCVQWEEQFNLMGYGDGPRVKCRSEVGKQMQSSRPKAQGGLDQGQTQGSGWSRGSTLEDQQAGLGSRTRTRVRRWAPRTQG